MTYVSPTTINGSQGLIGMIYYVNNVTDQWFAHMFLIALYVILLIIGYKASDGDVAGSLGVTGFVIFVIGLLAWLSGFISGVVFGFVIAVALISVVIFLADKNRL